MVSVPDRGACFFLPSMGMEAEGSGGKAVGSGQCQWTSTQSSYMRTFLANIVANDTKILKKVHHNACAKALNDHFKLNRTGDQIVNHLKTRKRKYARINQLRKLSAAIWDEDNYIISLDHEHYTNHIVDHKADDEYLNKPLNYYDELLTIFGNSVATGKYAKGSNDPLGTGGEGEDNGGEDIGATATADDNGATSSASRPSKRAKIVESDYDGLIAAFDRSSDKFSAAILEAAKVDKELPEGLFASVDDLPGFEHIHKSYYYAHLCTPS